MWLWHYVALLHALFALPMRIPRHVICIHFHHYLEQQVAALHTESHSIQYTALWEEACQQAAVLTK